MVQCGNAFPVLAMATFTSDHQPVGLNLIFSITDSPVEYQAIVLFQPFILSLSLGQFYQSHKPTLNPPSLSQSLRRITSDEIASKFRAQIKGKIVLITGWIREPIRNKPCRTFPVHKLASRENVTWRCKNRQCDEQWLRFWRGQI